MKTQVSILVKNEPLLSRFFSLMWFINIFKKMSVNMWLDQDPQSAPGRKIKAGKEPHVIDVEPGEHVLCFTDPRAAGKKAFRALTGAIIGGSVAGGMGGSMLMGGVIGADMAGGNGAGDGYAVCNLREGDVFRIAVRPTRKGAVKVKMLKAA